VLKAQGVAFCVVGDTALLPDCIPSDLDIIVDFCDADRLPQLMLKLGRETGTKLIQVLRHEQQASYFIIAGFGSDGKPWFLHPDFSCGYREAGRPLLDPHRLLAESRPAVGSNGDPTRCVVAAAANEFIYYLLKKTEKGALNERQAQHLSATYREDPIGAALLLRRFFGATTVDLIDRAGISGDWSEVRPALPRLRRELHSGHPISWVERLRELPRVIDRILRPTGLWVVFLGPDGSGKSTILKRVAAEIAPAFRRTQLFHLRAPLIDGTYIRSGADPHGRPARGAIASLGQLLLNVVRCWFGYWLRVWPALMRSTFVGFDRYFHDLLVDPRRYRYGGPRWLAKLTSAAVPTPDLWILLDAPRLVIEARKKEVPSSEIDRQRRAYRELVTRLRGGHIVDAAKSLDEVVHDVELIIISFLAARIARRLALDKR
jgi:thymidylate kinase